MALAAVRRGKSVAVVERNARALGASIRNFDFITVSGQKACDHWARARRSRDVWAEVAQAAESRFSTMVSSCRHIGQRPRQCGVAFLATVTGGAGASTGFALGGEAVADLFD